MKKILIVLAIVLAAFSGYKAHAWKRHTDIRSFYAEASGSYLFGPSGVINAKGEALSRQQLLDAYLELQLEQHPEWGLKFSTHSEHKK